MAAFEINDTVDITDVNCQITFVKAKVELDELEEGEILKVHMNAGEPANNVPRSFKEEGHEVLDLIENDDGTFDLFVRKVGD